MWSVHLIPLGRPAKVKFPGAMLKGEWSVSYGKLLDVNVKEYVLPICPSTLPI